MSIALLLFPDFALILLGNLFRRLMHLGDHFWAGLEKLIYFVLFPAMLFLALTRTRIDFAAVAPLVYVGGLATAAGILLARLTPLLFPAFRQGKLSFAAQFQCGFRVNTYIGLALAGTLHGAAGIAAMGVLLGVMVPIVNIVAVWMLARHGEAKLWRELVRNPLVLATLGGILFNLAGLALPRPAQALLIRLADASLALGLLAVGAALKLRGHPADATQLGGRVYLLAVKLMAMPALAWALARQFALSGVYFDVAVAFAALPTAGSAYILAQRMGADGSGVAWLISLSTLLAMASLPLWLALIA